MSEWIVEAGIGKVSAGIILHLVCKMVAYDVAVWGWGGGEGVFLFLTH